MKREIFFLTLCFSLVVLSTTAQNIDTKNRWTPQNQLKFDFVPSATLDLEFKFFSGDQTTNHLLKGTGYLLQGLKFSSAVDQFNAVAPFDFRAYKPLKFSSYSHSIQNNYLLVQPIQTIK